MGWIRHLQERWNLNGGFQIFIVLLVFACTGFTVFFIKTPLLRMLFENEIPSWARILYYVIILPVYNVLLLFYGFVFGHFRFFWEFEKKTAKKIASAFRKK